MKTTDIRSLRRIVLSTDSTGDTITVTVYDGDGAVVNGALVDVVIDGLAPATANLTATADIGTILSKLGNAASGIATAMTRIIGTTSAAGILRLVFTNGAGAVCKVHAFAGNGDATGTVTL